MKIILLKLVVAITLFFFPLLSSCGIGGTETGNPTPGAEDDGGDSSGDTDGDSGDGTGSDEPQGEGPAGAAAQTKAEDIRDSLCSKLVDCNESLSTARCESGIVATDNIDTELGLNEGTYDSYQSIIDAEGNGEISADSAASSGCQTDLAALTCTDSLVIAAYDSDDPDNFDNVFGMIPLGSDSCEGIFGD